MSTPATTPERLEAGREAAPSLLSRALALSTVGPLIALLLAIGQTLVILTAEIDLSNGAVMAFGSIVMTKLAVASGIDPFVAIALGILACVAFGAFNGALVTSMRLPPFIVTLGTLNIAFALTHIYSNEQTI